MKVRDPFRFARVRHRGETILHVDDHEDISDADKHLFLSHRRMRAMLSIAVLRLRELHDAQSLIWEQVLFLEEICGEITTRFGRTWPVFWVVILVASFWKKNTYSRIEPIWYQVSDINTDIAIKIGQESAKWHDHLIMVINHTAGDWLSHLYRINSEP
jgi:hypothetical protein